MKRLFFDIETSPCLGWFWRPGWKVRLSYDNIIEHAKIICISYKWENEDKVQTLVWDKDKDDGKMIKKFIKVMNSADEIIAHNGDRFDLKWIRSRALTHGINSVPRWASFDTLKSVRANIQLPSNRLGDIGRYFGLSEKIKTDPDLWKNIVFGDSSRMQEMIDYCEQDVILLEQVYQKVKGVVPLKTHVGVTGMREKWSCPACGSQKVVVKSHTNCTSATGVRKHQMHCKEKECGRYYHISGLIYTNYLKQTRLRKK